ncbi:MAG: SCO family protein [Vicinamibacteraceae bacterium]
MSSSRTCRIRWSVGPLAPVGLLFILVGCMAAGGCGRGQPARESEFEMRPGAQQFPLVGRVVAVAPSARKVTVAHEEVEGVMQAMTMEFPVKEQWAMQAMAPGDRIAATLVVDGARSWLQQIVVTRSTPSGEPGGDRAAPLPGAPAPGTRLPALSLVDQNAQPVLARDFIGRVSVVTFIYTRCPLPDFCPLMMRRFTETAKLLRDRPDRTTTTQLVPVTIDPEYDTPAVLRKYAARLITRDDAGEDASGRGDVTWRLLTGEAEDVRRFAGFFGLVYEQQGSEIMHALRTAIIDPQGRVVTVLRGNAWTAGELLRHIDGARNWDGAPPPRETASAGAGDARSNR